MATKRPRCCLICHEPTHQTWQHTDEPEWDLDIAALCCVTVGILGLIAVVIVTLCPHN